jgi:predicted transcriptional regulator
MESGRQLLNSLDQPRTVEEAASLINMPLFRVRSGLRQLVESGLISQTGDRYQIQEAGREKLKTESR